MGKLLVAVGGAVVLAGLVVWALERYAPGFRPGRLPGDVVVERPGFAIYVPLATSVLLSLVLTFVLWLVAGRRG